MLELHPNILEKEGRKEFVVLPYEEFLALQQILTDAQDLMDLREAKDAEQDAPSMTFNEVKQQLGL